MEEENQEGVYLPLIAYISEEEKENFYPLTEILPYLSGLKDIVPWLGDIDKPLEFIRWLEHNCMDIWHFWGEGEAFFCEGFYTLDSNIEKTTEQEEAGEYYLPPHTITRLPAGFYRAEYFLHGEDSQTTGFAIEPSRAGSDTWFISSTAEIKDVFFTADYDVIKKTPLERLYLDKGTTKAILRPPLFNKMQQDMGREIEPETFPALPQNALHSTTQITTQIPAGILSPKTINKQAEIIAAMALLLTGNKINPQSFAGARAAADLIIEKMLPELTSKGIKEDIISGKALAAYIKEGLERIVK